MMVVVGRYGVGRLQNHEDDEEEEEKNMMI